MKKILITSTDMMMMQFLVPHVLHLREQGYQVEVACSEVGGRFAEVQNALGVDSVHKVRLHRSPIKAGNVKGLADLKGIINNGSYDLIWTNEPVMGVMTRLAAKKARKKGAKVMYMAHGFHFFKGASRLNWCLYYPIEKLMASQADVIATVNTEDYQRAKQFKVGNVVYIHGIGINTDRLKKIENHTDIRQELGLEPNTFILLSVGELNENKNQEVALRAFAMAKDENMHYVLCGKGAKLEYLKNLTVELGVEKQVHFLGYRKDVVDICYQSNIYVMPSKREGLPVAALEAMYCGLALVTSNIRGLVDVMQDGDSGYMHSPDDVDGFAESIKKLKADDDLRAKMGVNNQKTVEPYCLSQTKKEVLEIIQSMLG